MKAVLEKIEAREKISLKKVEILAQKVAPKIQDVKVSDIRRGRELVTVKAHSHDGRLTHAAAADCCVGRKL